LRATEQPARAAASAAELLPVATAWGTDGARSEALRNLARATDGSADAIDLLRASVAHGARSPARLVHAQALLELGAALRRGNARRDSREPLREALQLADLCGADGLAAAATEELAASGVHVTPRAPTGAAALTSSERRIAELAAAGASNAEIAQALFVTVKTIEMHLTRSYRKLGINGRQELAARL
jgi:DNA-binding CsgD family transcriptional regulator